jgi:hypothetical protein
MPLVQYGEYRPDVSDYEGATTKNILNVLPQGDGYGPFPDFTSYSAALPGICRGAFYALKGDGTVATFTGTEDRLYIFDNTTFAWVDASQGGAAYSALSGTAQWRFAQFNNLVFATQANDVLQVFNLSDPVRGCTGRAAPGGLYRSGRALPRALGPVVGAISYSVVGTE